MMKMFFLLAAIFLLVLAGCRQEAAEVSGSLPSLEEIKECCLEIFIAGTLFACAFYQLALFLFRKKELSALFLCLFCLTLLIRSLLDTEQLMALLLPALPAPAVKKWAGLLIFPGNAFYAFFFYNRFKAGSSRRLAYGLTGLGLGFAVLALAAPSSFYACLDDLPGLSAILCSLYFFTALLIPFVKQAAGVSLLPLLGQSALSAALILENAGAYLYPGTGHHPFSTCGLLAFMLTQAILSLRQSARACREVETLTGRLQRAPRLAQQYTLLLAVTDESWLGLLAAELKADYKLVMAPNGLEARHAAGHLPGPDLIITNLTPEQAEENAFTTGQHRFYRQAHIPCLFLTTGEEQKEKINLPAACAVDYLQQPFEIGELKARIIALLLFKQQYERYFLQAAARAAGEQAADDLLPFPGEAVLHQCRGNYAKFHLPNREKEIIQLLLRGLEYKEIARELHLAVKTIDNRIQRIYKKMGVHNKIDLLNRLAS